MQSQKNACTAKCSHKNACTAKCGHFANKYRMSLFARCKKPSYKALCLLRHGSLPYRHTVCFAVSCLQTFFNACTAKCGHFANKYRMSLFARCQKHTKHASQSSSKSKLLRIYINRRYQNECVIKR